MEIGFNIMYISEENYNEFANITVRYSKLMILIFGLSLSGETILSEDKFIEASNFIKKMNKIMANSAFL